MKKKKKTKLNYPRIIAAAIIVVALIGVLIFMLNRPSNSGSGDNSGSNQQVASSSDPYSIRSNATDYQKEIYQELQDALKSKNSQSIAEALAKNFVADFFTLSNKTIKNDVGGTQFWSTDARLTLRTKAIDTFYTNLELYIEDYGSENLPTVKEVTVLDSSSMDGYNLYAVSVTWTYESNSKFDTSEFQNSAMLEITNESGTSFIYNFY